jgi:hypothetical protein
VTLRTTKHKIERSQHYPTNKRSNKWWQQQPSKQFKAVQRLVAERIPTEQQHQQNEYADGNRSAQIIYALSPA